MQLSATEKLKKTGARTLTGFKAEQEAFRRQFKGLLRRYRNQFVAFSGGRVVGHGSDDEALAGRMFAKLGNAHFAIFLVAERPRVYDFDSPELVR